MKWLGSHRSFVVETFFTNSGSITATQRLFRTHFKLGRHDPVPSRNTILLWIKNFRKNGSALKRRSTGRPRTSTTPENAMAVKASVQQSPQRSARKHAAALRISATSVRRILRKELQMHPYKIMLAQELNKNDFETRRALCLEIQQNVRMDALVLYSDEAHFHLCGTVNKQNFRYWAESNPRSLHERPLHCPRVTVWCAIARFGIWGPYFFEEENVVATVNSDRYCKMLENFLKPRLNEREDQHPLWFQQDGATAHTSRNAIKTLKEMFPNHLISMRGDIGWPPRSPDLNPCDYFLWGYLKSKVYTQRPRSVEELKDAINNHGKHLTDLIFKT